MSGSTEQRDAWVATTLDIDPALVQQARRGSSEASGAWVTPLNSMPATWTDDPGFSDVSSDESAASSSSASNSVTFATVTSADETAALPLSPMPDWAREVDLKKAKIGKAIKSGAFGSVSWLSRTGETPLVIKVPKTEGNRKELAHEAEFYAKIGEHPNIAKCMGIQEVEGRRGLVMEGIQGKDMHGAMDKLEALRKGDKTAMQEAGMDRALSQEGFVGTLQYMLTQTLQGLSKLQDSKVIHADVRPDNIMCDALTGAVKLVDLGLAVDDEQRPAISPVQHGSVGPEFAETGGVTTKYDVFSAGEIAHKAMERDQFRYGTNKARFGLQDLRNFAAPDASGNAKTALNPRGQHTGGGANGAGVNPASMKERIDGLERRIDKLLKDPFIKGTPPATELAAALETLRNGIAADQTEDEKDAVLTPIEKRIDLAETGLKTVGTYGAQTAYTTFVNWAMHPDPAQRPSAREALEHPFLTDPLLDDEAARSVLKQVLGGGSAASPASLDGGSGSTSGSGSGSGSSYGSASATELGSGSASDSVDDMTPVSYVWGASGVRIWSNRKGEVVPAPAEAAAPVAAAPGSARATSFSTSDVSSDESSVSRDESSIGSDKSSVSSDQSSVGSDESSPRVSYSPSLGVLGDEAGEAAEVEGDSAAEESSEDHAADLAQAAMADPAPDLSGRGVATPPIVPAGRPRRGRGAPPPNLNPPVTPAAPTAPPPDVAAGAGRPTIGSHRPPAQPAPSADPKPKIGGHRG